MKLTHIAARPDHLYWRNEVCPYKGSKVLLRTIGGVAVVGNWTGDLNEFFVAWCPLPANGTPRPNPAKLPLWQRVRFAITLIFKPERLV